MKVYYVLVVAAVLLCVSMRADAYHYQYDTMAFGVNSEVGTTDMDQATVDRMENGEDVEIDNPPANEQQQEEQPETQDDAPRFKEDPKHPKPFHAETVINTKSDVSHTGVYHLPANHDEKRPMTVKTTVNVKGDKHKPLHVPEFSSLIDKAESPKNKSEAPKKEATKQTPKAPVKAPTTKPTASGKKPVKVVTGPASGMYYPPLYPSATSNTPLGKSVGARLNTAKRAAPLPCVKTTIAMNNCNQPPCTSSCKTAPYIAETDIDKKHHAKWTVTKQEVEKVRAEVKALKEKLAVDSIAMKFYDSGRSKVNLKKLLRKKKVV